MPPILYLAVDPGRARWGLAGVSASGECLFREVVPAEAAAGRVDELRGHYAFAAILLGDRTGSSEARCVLERAGLPLLLVSEHGTTLLARDLYWRHSPPRGWRRLLPRGMLIPPVPLDGYAAQALALRYLGLLGEEE